MIDTDTPGSDGFWLKQLSRQMWARPPRIIRASLGHSRRADFRRNDWLDMLWNRYVGDAPLMGIAEQYAEATREFLRMTRTNFAELVVNALLERLEFQGVRPSDGDNDGDDWIRGFLGYNPVVPDALTYALTLGEGWLMVGPPGDGDEFPLATAEDPRQIAAAFDPVRPDTVQVLLKLYYDVEQEQTVAAIYRRAENGDKDRLRTAVRPGKPWRGYSFSDQGWSWDDNSSDDLTVQGQGVPFIPLRNRMSIGEFEKHLDLLDRITNGIADRLWAAKYQIFIQRALIGDLPEEDEEGNKIDYDSIFSVDPAALWRMPDGSNVWESRQLDLTPLLNAVKEDLRELSAVTSTPMHMFTPDAMTGSAEGASLARDGLTFKGRDRIGRFSPALVRFAKLGQAYGGQDVKTGMKAMWGPVTQYSLQQRGAAAVQAKASNVPTESIWSDVWQFDPETVARMRQERITDELYTTPADGNGTGQG